MRIPHRIRFTSFFPKKNCHLLNFHSNSYHFFYTNLIIKPSIFSFKQKALFSFSFKPNSVSFSLPIKLGRISYLTQLFYHIHTISMHRLLLEKEVKPHELHEAHKPLLMDGPKQEEPKEFMVKPPRSFWRRKWTTLDKRVAYIISFVHLLCIFAPFHFNWSAFRVAVALQIITGLFGMTISYHRNLAHKSFKLPKWLEYLFAYCGVQALQGDPIDWVSTHRCHHQFVDTDKDPHSPIQGFWNSHMMWLFDSYTLTNKVCPKYSSDLQKIDRNMFVFFSKHGRPDNVGDLEKQWFYRFIHKTYILHPIGLAIILYNIGGVPFLIWGMCVRIVVIFHSTFMVNSVCHIWGKQPWRTGDLSRNNWFVGLTSFGEGWHNNHHAFKYSARLGLEWWQLDAGWYVIKFLQLIGLATDVKLPSLSHMQNLAMDKVLN